MGSQPVNKPVKFNSIKLQHFKSVCHLKQPTTETKSGSRSEQHQQQKKEVEINEATGDQILATSRKLQEDDEAKIRSTQPLFDKARIDAITSCISEEEEFGAVFHSFLDSKNQPGNRFSEEDRRGKSNEEERQQQQRLCSYCGGDYHRTLSDCPAKGHRCDICRKFNHFEDVCRQKQPQRDRQDPSTNGESLRYQQDPAAKAKVNFLYGDSSEEENAFRLHSYQAINESSDTGSEEDVVEVLSQQQQHQQRNSNSDQFQTVKGGDETCDGYGTTLSISNRPGAANDHEKEEKEAVEEIEANNIHQFFESLSH